MGLDMASRPTLHVVPSEPDRVGIFPDGTVSVLGADGFGAVRSAASAWSGEIRPGTFTVSGGTPVSDAALARKLSREARTGLSGSSGKASQAPL